MEKNKINLFNQSGCLSREAILASLENRLSPAEKFLVQEHVGDCLLCKDALEGYYEISPVHSRNLLVDLNYSMQHQLLHSDPKKSLSRKLKLSLAAAVLLAFVGIFSIIRFLPKEKGSPVAQDFPREVLSPKTDESAVANRKESQAPEREQITSSQVRKQPVPAASRNESSENTPEPVASVQEEATLADIPEVNAEEAKSVPVENEVEGYITQAPASAKKSEQVSARGVRYSEKSLAVGRKTNSETTFYVVEEPAKFQGGDLNKFKAFVEEKLLQENRIHKSSGSMVISFTINTQGKPKDIFVTKGIDSKTDSTAIAIIKNSTGWQPARHKGEVVNVNMILSLNIKSD